MIAITQKPTQVSPAILAAASEAIRDNNDQDLKVLQQKLESLKQIPKKKFNYPQTAAQELGWDMDTMFDTHKPKYGLNKRECAECTYANSYVTMTSRSPFAAPRPLNEAANTAKK